MKKMLALVLALALLLSAAPAAWAEISPEAYYIVAQTAVEALTGQPPAGNFTDSDFNGIMAIMVMDGSRTASPQVAVFGPGGQYTIWQLPGKSTDDMLELFVQVLEFWQVFSYDISGHAFGVIFSSEQHGSLTIRSQADAQTVISTVRGSSPTPTVQPVQPTAAPSSRPIVPSMLSFANYRIKEENRIAESNYVAIRDGLKNDEVTHALAQDYVELLTTEYPYRLVETIDGGYGEVIYLLDYTGAGNVRPVVWSGYSADVIVRVWSHSMCWIDVHFSPNFDYVETDDRTTVNLR